MQELMAKLIKVRDETHKRLSKLGTVGNTFDDVVTELLDFYEENKK
jgi:hypothetical protein